MTCPAGQIFDIRSLRCGNVQTSVCNNDNQVEDGQKDLLIVFDATGSMRTDLAQLREAAIEIVKDLSNKEQDPINKYVLSVFRDPGKLKKAFIFNQIKKIIFNRTYIFIISQMLKKFS